jgi:hypothetical protein
VFLGAKLEEVQRRARDVINVFHRLERRKEHALTSPLTSPNTASPEPLLDMFGKRYDELKGELIRCERHMLREFGFIAHVEHPHKFVLNYAQVLELDTRVMQAAWGHANDSLRTTLCVRFPAEVIACGAIHLAARNAGVALPEGGAENENDADGDANGHRGGSSSSVAWWSLFGVTRAEVGEVASVVSALYALPKCAYIKVGPDAAGDTPTRHGGGGSEGSAPVQPAPVQPAAAPRQVVVVPPQGGGGLGAAAMAAAMHAAQQAAQAAAAGVAARAAAAAQAVAAAAQAAAAAKQQAGAQGAQGAARGERRRSRSRSRERERERDRERESSRGGRDRRRCRSRSRGERRRSRSRERRRSRGRR